MPSAIRERPMSVAPTMNAIPAGRENASTAKAIANAAAAWSLGNEGSVVRAASTCVRPGCSANGRGRSHSCAITWFTASATAAAISADDDASFQRGLPYGRARSHSATVASAYSGTATSARAVT